MKSESGDSEHHAHDEFNFDQQQRRFHLYQGMQPEKYHEHFDTLHSKRADHEIDFEKMKMGLSRSLTPKEFKSEKKPLIQ